MAKAFKNITTKIVQKPVEVTTEEIVLTLSKREAALLTMLLGYVGAHTNSPGEYRESISKELYKLGFGLDDHKYIDETTTNGLQIKQGTLAKFDAEFPE